MRIPVIHLDGPVLSGIKKDILGESMILRLFKPFFLCGLPVFLRQERDFTADNVGCDQKR